MLLHIHNFFFFLLRAYHSMQSTLPCHRGSRGALQQQWEEKTLKKAPVNHGVSSCFLEVQPFRYFRGENSKKFQMSKCTSHAAKLKGRGHWKTTETVVIHLRQYFQIYQIDWAITCLWVWSLNISSPFIILSISAAICIHEVIIEVKHGIVPADILCCSKTINSNQIKAFFFFALIRLPPSTPPHPLWLAMHRSLTSKVVSAHSDNALCVWSVRRVPLISRDLQRV